MAASPAQNIAPRHWLLGGALVATIAVTLWGALRRLPEVGVTALTEARSISGPTSHLAPPALPLHPVPRVPWRHAADKQFVAWLPPSQAPSSPAMPPSPAAPVAPPLPYQMIGRLVEDGRPVALLASDTRTLAVRVGDDIDGEWRVDAITDTSLELRWRPASLKLRLVFGGAP